MDYKLVNHQFKNCVNDVQRVPGIDTDSDYNLLVVKVCTG
jgi:hypothetical protein